MSVYKSVSKSVFRSVHPSTKVPSALIGSGNTPFTFRAGPAGTPENGTNSATIAVGFFAGESLPVSSELTKVEYYVSANCSCQIMLAVPAANGGFDVTILATKSSLTGVNSYTVAAGDLPATTIPPNSLIGVRTVSLGAIRYKDDTTTYGRSKSLGYHHLTGFTTAGNYQLVNGYTHEMQIAWEATAIRGSQEYVINETFGTTKPAYSVHAGTAWTYSAGSATPGATGIANRLYWYQSSNAHLQTLSVEFQFDDSSGKLFIGKEIALGGASVDYGSLASIDIATNNIELYNPYNTAGTLPTVRYTESITAMTLVTGRTYRFEMIKVNKDISIRITDTSTNDTQLFTWAVSALYGYGFGRPVMFSTAGTLHLTKVQWSFGNILPKFLIFGDSITEGSGATSNLSGYAGQLCAGGEGMFAGDGGTTAISCLREMQQMCRMVMPQYVVLVAGANNSQSDVERDRYIDDMRTFWAKARQWGITPIIATVTPYNDATRQTRTDVMNAAITADAVSDSVAVINMHTALGGSVWTTGVMADSVHPNQAGNDLMYAQALTDQPQAF